jgi:hypothetical protein
LRRARAGVCATASAPRGRVVELDRHSDVKRPAEEPADPPPHPPLPPGALVLPDVFTKDPCKLCADPPLQGKHGGAWVLQGSLATRREKGGHRAASTKNKAQREYLQLDQSLQLKRYFVIFAKKRMLQAALQQVPHRVLLRTTPSTTCTAKIPWSAPTAPTA